MWQQLFPTWQPRMFSWQPWPREEIANFCTRHIRLHSHEVTAQLKAGRAYNDLLDRLRADPAFAQVDFDSASAAANLVGRAPQQVDEFIEQEIAPVQHRYRHLVEQTADVTL